MLQVTPSPIRNFAMLDERVATGGQPSEQQLELLVEAGIEAVINLGLLDPRYALEDEARSVSALGMEYHHLPVQFDRPEPSDYDRFEEIMRAAGTKKVFVHCAMNYRVSCFTALWAERELGWSRERADGWIRRQWQTDAVWSDFLARVRRATNQGHDE